MDNMTAERALDVLLEHNEWRRGATDEYPDSAKELGQAINFACSVLSAPRAPEGWQHEAARWLEAQAVEQEQTNKQHPRHADSYKGWRDAPATLRLLAQKLRAAPDEITSLREGRE